MEGGAGGSDLKEDEGSFFFGLDQLGTRIHQSTIKVFSIEILESL